MQLVAFHAQQFPRAGPRPGPSPGLGPEKSSLVRSPKWNISFLFLFEQAAKVARNKHKSCPHNSYVGMIHGNDRIGRKDSFEKWNWKTLLRRSVF